MLADRSKKQETTTKHSTTAISPRHVTHTLALMTLTVTRIQFILAGIICCVETGPPTAARRATAGNRSFLSPRWQLVSARACALRTAGHPWHYVTVNWKGCVRTAICLGVVLTHGDSASAAVVWHRGKLYVIYSAAVTFHQTISRLRIQYCIVVIECTSWRSNECAMTSLTLTLVSNICLLWSESVVHYCVSADYRIVAIPYCCRMRLILNIVLG